MPRAQLFREKNLLGKIFFDKAPVLFAKHSELSIKIHYTYFLLVFASLSLSLSFVPQIRHYSPLQVRGSRISLFQRNQREGWAAAGHWNWMPAAVLDVGLQFTAKYSYNRTKLYYGCHRVELRLDVEKSLVSATAAAAVAAAVAVARPRATATAFPPDSTLHPPNPLSSQ